MDCCYALNDVCAGEIWVPAVGFGKAYEVEGHLLISDFVCRGEKGRWRSYS